MNAKEFLDYLETKMEEISKADVPSEALEEFLFSDEWTNKKDQLDQVHHTSRFTKLCNKYADMILSRHKA